MFVGWNGGKEKKPSLCGEKGVVVDDAKWTNGRGTTARCRSNVKASKYVRVRDFTF
jgi:hypothetical protein